MDTRMYTLRDLKVGAWQFPFPAVNDDTALRAIKHRIASEPDSLYATFPADYELYYIGIFNNDSCQMTPEGPTFIAPLSALTPLEAVA